MPVPTLLCLGEALIEFNQIDKNNNIYAKGFGGDTSNTAIAAARQGLNVGYISAVGEDEFGKDLLGLWQQETVDCRYVRRHPNAPTGLYFIHHDDHGHRFSYRRKDSAASLMQVNDLPLDAIADAKMLHVSGISQAISDNACEAVFAAIAHAKAHQTLVTYDTNLRLALWDLDKARQIIHQTIAQVDCLLPSYDDVVVLTKLKTPEKIIDYYLELGAKNILLKLGRDGVLVANREKRQRLDAYSVDAVDATGAGDTFAGAFLAAFNESQNIFSAAHYANAAAALSTTAFGAVASIPYRNHVEALMAP